MVLWRGAARRGTRFNTSLRRADVGAGESFPRPSGASIEAVIAVGRDLRGQHRRPRSSLAEDGSVTAVTMTGKTAQVSELVQSWALDPKCAVEAIDNHVLLSWFDLS